MNHTAIYALYPNVVMVDDGLGAFDINDNKVEIDEALVNAWNDPNQYKYNRASEYPALADQLDMLYHDRINSTDTWMEAIQAVKTKYPKS